MKNYERITAGNTIASAIANVRANVKLRTATVIKKTEDFKNARMDAQTDEIVWTAQMANLKNANPKATVKQLEAAMEKMGYQKPESEQETIERLQQEFLIIDQNEAVAKYTDDLEEGMIMADMAAVELPDRYAESRGSYNDVATQTSTAPSRTYYTGREQYEAHRAVTRDNIENKRGASAMERFDSNMNAFSQHLEIFARKFKR